MAALKMRSAYSPHYYSSLLFERRGTAKAFPWDNTKLGDDFFYSPYPGRVYYAIFICYTLYNYTREVTAKVIQNGQLSDRWIARIQTEEGGERRNIMAGILRFLKDEDGATAVEYGIMVAAIAAVIIAVVIAIGGKANNAFEKVNSGLSQTPIN